MRIVRQTLRLRLSRYLSSETLTALQIIHAESHPNSLNQGPTNGASGSKEGLSVYGLFHHYARTPQGKYLLRQHFLRPSLDLDTIAARHTAISVFLRADNGPHVENMNKSLKSIKNIKPVLMHLRKGMSNGGGKNGISNGVWSSLRSVLAVSSAHSYLYLQMSVHVLRTVNPKLHSRTQSRRSSGHTD